MREGKGESDCSSEIERCREADGWRLRWREKGERVKRTGIERGG